MKRIQKAQKDAKKDPKDQNHFTYTLVYTVLKVNVMRVLELVVVQCTSGRAVRKQSVV